MKRTLASGFAPYAFINGFAQFKWGGMLTEGSPGANPSNRPRLILNGLVRDGDIINRPALVKHSTSTAGTCILGLHDHGQRGAPIRLWCAVNSCPSASGASLVAYSPDQDPAVQLYAKCINIADTFISLEMYDGQFYFGENENLRLLQPFPIPFGTTGVTLGGVQDRIVKQFVGFSVTCLRAFDSKLFIGLDAGAASKIVAYDGVTFTDDLTGINPPLAFGTGRDKLIVGFAAATNAIRVRPTGAPPQTYATVAPGAGTVEAYQNGNSITSWRDSVWIAGGTAVWKYDWSTLAIAVSPAGATSVRSVAVANDILFYGYNTALAAIIGEYNNVTFTDVRKNLTTQFANDTIIFALTDFNGALFAGMAGTTAVGANYSAKLFCSPPLYDISGTWLGTGSSAPPNPANGAISLVVR